MSREVSVGQRLGEDIRSHEVRTEVVNLNKTIVLHLTSIVQTSGEMLGSLMGTSSISDLDATCIVFEHDSGPVLWVAHIRKQISQPDYL